VLVSSLVVAIEAVRIIERGASSKSISVLNLARRPEKWEWRNRAEPEGHTTESRAAAAALFVI
jgi:hypothetical protein